MEKVVTFEDLEPLLDKFFPPGCKREIWWVTEKSLNNGTCKACGKCCAMVGLGHSIDELREMDSVDPDLQFVVKNFIPIPAHEAGKRGGCSLTHFYICRRLTEEGLCSIHEDKPGFCARHPVLGQTLLKECVFAGTNNFDKSPRGIEAGKIMAATKLLKGLDRSK